MFLLQVLVVKRAILLQNAIKIVIFISFFYMNDVIFVDCPNLYHNMNLNWPVDFS